MGEPPTRMTCACTGAAYPRWSGYVNIHPNTTTTFVQDYRVATSAFELTPNEVTLLDGAVPGQALVLCAGERMFLDVVASSAERELFDTRPAEQAERNRQRRRGLLKSDPKPVPAAEQTPVASHASPSSSSTSSERSWHLFDDLEPDDDSPIPLPTWRRRR